MLYEMLVRMLPLTLVNQRILQRVKLLALLLKKLVAFSLLMVVNQWILLLALLLPPLSFT